MATEKDRLILSLEARQTQLEREMKRASRTTGREFRKMEKQASTAAARMAGAFKNFGAGVFAGVAAGGLVGIAGQINTVAESIAQIGDEADRAGVSARAFQEWKFVAEQNRIGIDSMVDGLKEMNLRADEFVVTGKGPAEEAFRRLGYGAEELRTKLKNPSDLLLEIIGRLGRMERAAQIRISDEIFGGTAGERFVELLDQGEQGIRDTIRRAHELGAVVDDELIAKAADLNRRFNEISNTVGMNLKSAIVSAADSLAQFIDGFRNFEDRHSRSLENRLREIGKERLDLENEILAIREKQANAGGVLADTERRMLQGEINQIERQREALNADEKRILEILDSRTPAMTVTDRTWTPPSLPSPDGDGRDRTSQIERERQAVKNYVGELEFEISLIGQSDAAREKAIELRRVSAAATDEQTKQIERLLDIRYEENAAIRDQEQAYQQLEQIGTQALNSLTTALADGKLEGEEMIQIVIQLAQQLLSLKNIGGGSGGGGIFGFLGGLLGLGGGGLSATALSAVAAGAGGLYATGTANTGGRPGEPRGVVHGQEAVIPLPSGGKVPVDLRVPSLDLRAPPPPSLSLAPTQGGAQEMDVRVYVDQNGNWNAAVERISSKTTRQGLAQYDRSVLPSRVNQIAKDPRVR